jgi:hypothetical protein
VKLLTVATLLVRVEINAATFQSLLADQVDSCVQLTKLVMRARRVREDFATVQTRAKSWRERCEQFLTCFCSHCQISESVFAQIKSLEESQLATHLHGEENGSEIALTTRIERANKTVCISSGIARSRCSLRDLRIADSTFLLPP